MIDVQYTKTSDYRAHRFNLKTEIVDVDGIRYARKKAVYKEAEEHIESIYRNAERLKEIFEPEYRVCGLQKDGDSILFDYVDGRSYEELLSDAVLELDKTVIWSIIDAYYNLVNKMYTHNGFKKTPEFEAVFGNIQDDVDLETGNFVNVDLIFSNIISGPQTCIIDYEWCFEFPIPLKYVFWKGLFTSKAFSTLPEDFKKEVFNKYELSNNDRKQFLLMEEHFVNYSRGGQLSFAEETSKIKPISMGYDQLKKGIKSYPVVFFAVKDGVAKKVYEGISYPRLNVIDFTIEDDYDRLEMFIAPVQSIISDIKVISVTENEKRSVSFETTSEADDLEPRFFIRNTPVIIVREKCCQIHVQFDVKVWNDQAFEQEIFDEYLNRINFVSDATQRVLADNQHQIEQLNSDLHASMSAIEQKDSELQKISLELQQKDSELQKTTSELQQKNSELQQITSVLETKKSELGILQTEYDNTMATLRRKNIFKAFLYFIRLRKD